MNALLVRVAADQSEAGGYWNGPADPVTKQFVYVAIPESSTCRPGLNKPYQLVAPALTMFGLTLPLHLAKQDMHLDPDFEHLTYGDTNERAKQIATKVGPDDLLVFYAGLRDLRSKSQLVYALIGLYVIEEIVQAVTVPSHQLHENAHTRRASPANQEIVVRARRGISGRMERCIPIGDYRERAYRVWPELLTEWGGLSVTNGFLQRSGRLPEFADAGKFFEWFQRQKVPLVQRNN
jgi:hypothetical protein